MDQAAHRLQDSFATLVSSLTADQHHQTRNTIQNAEQRFRGWAGGLGACRPETDARSLSYRLRNSLPLRRRIDEIFEELELLLEKASHLALSKSASDTSTHRSGREENDEDVEDELLSQLRGISTSSEALTTWTLRSIDDAITRLFRFSRHISQITTTDRFSKAQISQRGRIDEHYDRLHVHAKFRVSSAPAWLLDRLGTANAQRRQYIHYSREHRELIEPSAARVSRARPTGARNVSPVKLAKISPPPTESSCRSEGLTTASTIQELALKEIDDGFDDVQSCSTVDTSIAQDLGPKLLTVPPLSAFASPGSYFNCPYCFTTQRFNGQAGWKKHVYHDVRPFICTFNECGMLMFDDKRSWFEHEMDTHRRNWLCALCKNSTLKIQTSQDLSNHLETAHGIRDQEQVKLLLEVSSLPMDKIPAKECKLCDWDAKLRSRKEHSPSYPDITVTPRDFMHHLGFHLTQVALFALPRIPEQSAAKPSSLEADAGSGRSSGFSEESRDPFDVQMSDSHRLALWSSTWFCTTKLICFMVRARRKRQEQEGEEEQYEEEEKEGEIDHDLMTLDAPSLALSQHGATRISSGMLLLTLNDHGDPIFAEDYDREYLPPYAILSHTWGPHDEEVTLQDLKSGYGKDKSGFQKILFCGQQAKKDGLKFFWVDTCCIDRSNIAELSESINSMFRWYQNSEKCYVYLADVSSPKSSDTGDLTSTWKIEFEMSRWHTRGWTLQEMIAPKSVEFFSRDGRLLGSREQLEHQLNEITSVPVKALRGAPLSLFSPNEKMRWAENRQTAKIEDEAYCLIGIFNVFLSPIYGEGDHAILRLKEKVMRRWGSWGESTPTWKPRNSGEHDDTVSLRPTARSATNTFLSSEHVESEDRNKREKQEIKEREERREALMASLFFEQMNSRHATIRVAHQGTCEWLLQHPTYLAWSQPNEMQERQNILCLNGKPGSGKSTLVKYVLSETKKAMSDSDILLSFFFNARGEELEKNAVGMYRSLLHQLLSQVPDLLHVLDKSDHSASDYNLVSEWSLEALQSMLFSTVTSLGSRRVRCFIDALDECSEQEMRHMVDIFEDLGERLLGHEVQLFVCFASRHYPAITICKSQHVVLEAETGYQLGLKKYIRQHLRVGKSKLANEIQVKILEKSNGVFLWAVLVLDILNQEFNRGRIFAVEKRLQEIPVELSELFKDILRQDRVNMEDFLLCLQWILFAKRPLRREEFYFAMVAGLSSTETRSWNPEEVTTEDMHRFVLNCSKGLAGLAKGQNPTVEFIHESVRDFLIKDNGMIELCPELGNDLVALSHERLKKCCLNYLRVDIKDLETPGKRKTEASKKLRARAIQTFPFLEYASGYILCHADEAAHGILQTDFLAEYGVSNGIDIANLLEMHENRRHNKDVNIEYILAEQGRARLLQAISARGYGQASPKERYQYPVLAAFANGHYNAIRALLGSLECSFIEGIPSDPGFGRASHIQKQDTALTWAMRNNNRALFGTLVTMQVAFGTPTGQNLNEFMALAAGKNWTDVIEMLLEKGCNIDYTSPEP